MHAITRSILVPLLYAIVISGPAQAGIVYSQSSDYPSNYNAVTSQSLASGGSYQSYDNFLLTSGATVKSVTFQGLYWNPDGPNFNPPLLPTPQNLQIGFYTSVNNLPGSLIGVTTLDNFQTASVGSSSFGPDNTGQFDTVNIYNFAGDLHSPFNFQANTQYWVSFVSFAGPTPPFWLWTSGTGGDGKSAQFRYGSTSYNYVSLDRTFSLSDDLLTSTLPGSPGPTNPPRGTVADVPEPASMTLLAIGFVCGGGVWLRRQRR